MKLDKKDNVRLMRECCIVREIEYTQKGDTAKADIFKSLREKIENSKTPSFKDLEDEFLDNSFSVKDFLNQMKNFKKSTINRTYYKRAVDAAKNYYASNDSIDSNDFNKKIRNQFFSENRIQNLRVRLNRRDAKFVGAATLATLLTAGALAITHPGGGTPEPTPTPISTENPEQFGDRNSTINDLQNNFLQLYAEANGLNQSAENLALDFSNQDYILKINHAGKVRYVSHGNFPNNIENYLKDKDISYERMSDCKSASIYATDSNREWENRVDEFGNPSEAKIDSVVWVRNEETGDMECVKLFDGNNPTKDGLVDVKEPTTTLTDLQKPLEVLSNTRGTNEDVIKSNYEKATQEYQESHALYSCAVENQIDEELER